MPAMPAMRLRRVSTLGSHGRRVLSVAAHATGPAAGIYAGTLYVVDIYCMPHPWR